MSEGASCTSVDEETDRQLALALQEDFDMNVEAEEARQKLKFTPIMTRNRTGQRSVTEMSKQLSYKCRCTNPICMLFNVEKRCRRHNCPQPYERHTEHERRLCRARPLKRGAPPLQLYCAFNACTKMFQDTSKTFSCPKTEWEEMHKPWNERSPERPEHAMRASSLRADVGRKVTVQHGEEKCRATVVEQEKWWATVVEHVDGNSAQSLHIFRFKDCHINQITLLPKSCHSQAGTMVRGWKGGLVMFGGRKFPAEDVTESCALSRSCFVPVKFVSKKESDHGLELELVCWKHVSYIVEEAASSVRRSKRASGNEGPTFRCAGTRCYAKSNANAVFKARLQWCLEPECQQAYNDGCEHRNHRGEIGATSRREKPELFCPTCFDAKRNDAKDFSSIDANQWQKLWFLFVDIVFVREDSGASASSLPAPTAASALQEPAKFDVMTATLSDLIDFIMTLECKATSVCLHAKDGGRLNLLEMDLSTKLEKALGGDQQKVYVSSHQPPEFLWHFQEAPADLAEEEDERQGRGDAGAAIGDEALSRDSRAESGKGKVRDFTQRVPNKEQKTPKGTGSNVAGASCSERRSPPQEEHAVCAGGQGRALIGARVKVLCDDECFYEGRVDGWTGSEWKIVLDDGDTVTSPIDTTSWDVEILSRARPARGEKRQDGGAGVARKRVSVCGNREHRAGRQECALTGKTGKESDKGGGATKEDALVILSDEGDDDVIIVSDSDDDSDRRALPAGDEVGAMTSGSGGDTGDKAAEAEVAVGVRRLSRISKPNLRVGPPGAPLPLPKYCRRASWVEEMEEDRGARETSSASRKTDDVDGDGHSLDGDPSHQQRRGCGVGDEGESATSRSSSQGSGHGPEESLESKAQEGNWKRRRMAPGVSARSANPCS